MIANLSPVKRVLEFHKESFSQSFPHKRMVEEDHKKDDEAKHLITLLEKLKIATKFSYGNILSENTDGIPTELRRKTMP